ncbi:MULTISPECIES: chitin disaccharide deacetylase [Coprobacillaceae]|uniref:chitin disaccharide deacetylase n=1 Tax=Coprobacillaceae TaxID=2810280 RepID=UPI000E482459|nr:MULTISPECIES: chitin disaccharide deacetylase [Coprobacillaceae]RHM60898.1 chitin disaccharide deacetylase [Coprobacillus sp. AF33-1AC]RHS94489.1 chitin disaccharide deacetylase [Erysipelatoclostridium sp. AM42-17]
MIKKLIVNGDDFGLSEGQTLGILKAHRDGILTSTTCLINMPFASQSLEMAKQYPQLGIGLHLTITIGKPVLKTGLSFTDENGYFKKRGAYDDYEPHPDQDELYQEWKAQIEKFISMTGKLPTHLDSHHHVHLLPQCIEVTKRLADEYHLPMRQDKPLINDYPFARFSEDFYGESVTKDMLYQIFNYDDEIFEIMCHPAFMDWTIYSQSSYNILRTKELELLCLPEIKDYLHKNHIELINYTQIKNGE